MRGLVWAEMAFPADHFSVNENMEEAEKTFESPLMGEQRRERCLWIAYQIAQIRTSGDSEEGRWITYDVNTKKFRPTAKYVSTVNIHSSITKATFLDDEDVLPEAELVSTSSGPESTDGGLSGEETD
ncbi:hypothetical protein ACKVWE_011483 [Pyricularia oryzae]